MNSKNLINWRGITPSEWLQPTTSDRRAARKGTCPAYEKEYLRRDGTRVPVF